ncbi:unnamed protein product [Clonostachys rosea f. rosea IK726]|uniref:Uncharacterized protein n=1 Tax=Clonostachys rosea f. rosea IK726 TaxID=1349383 RepID=A0ACA9UC72_BIOOC|nr:unnamed protein product [Clonostachys rosea f. rosea IK726]
MRMRTILRLPAWCSGPTTLSHHRESHTTLGQLAQNGIDPSDDRVHWFTLTFNNDIAILKKAMALHDALAADLKTTLGPAAFSTQCVLQPIPSFFGTIGARKGGNMLGLDAVKTNSILWLGTVAYKDPDHDKVAHKKLEKSFRELEKFAKSRNGMSSGSISIMRTKRRTHSSLTEKPTWTL